MPFNPKVNPQAAHRGELGDGTSHGKGPLAGSGNPLNEHLDPAIYDACFIDRNGLGRRQAGSRAGLQVKLCAMQRTGDLAAAHTPHVEKFFLVRADVGNRVNLALGADKQHHCIAEFLCLLATFDKLGVFTKTCKLLFQRYIPFTK